MSRRALKACENFIDDGIGSARLCQRAVTEPIEVHGEKQYAHSAHEIGGLGQTAQVIFLLHEVL